QEPQRGWGCVGGAMLPELMAGMLG
ncbi:MAG: hypothetical protein RLZZ142_1395, partial [Verrucomicrobiota bacterium]